MKKDCKENKAWIVILILLIYFVDGETFVCSFDDHYFKSNPNCNEFLLANRDNDISPLPLELVKSTSVSYSSSISASGTPQYTTTTTTTTI